jgi:hypothetical protein
MAYIFPITAPSPYNNHRHPATADRNTCADDDSAADDDDNNNNREKSAQYK